MDRGRSEGVVLGKAQGLAMGEAKALTRLLERRFGPLSESLRGRIDRAEVEALDRWLDRMDAATTIDAVFED